MLFDFFWCVFGFVILQTAKCRYSESILEFCQESNYNEKMYIDIRHFFSFSKMYLSQSLYPLPQRAGSEHTDYTFQIKLIWNILSKKHLIPFSCQERDFQYRRQSRPSLNNPPQDIYLTWVLGTNCYISQIHSYCVCLVKSCQGLSSWAKLLQARRA